MTSAAQAVVVSMNGGNLYGVEVEPDTAGAISNLSSLYPGPTGAACTDPWLSSDFGGPAMPSGGLCYHGGAVMHANETFALTWDPSRAYWSRTQSDLHQFLNDVATSSGSLGSIFSVTTQYDDAGGRAANASTFGGGCSDLGPTGKGCVIDGIQAAGHDYTDWGAGCTPHGATYCVSDSEIQGELNYVITKVDLVHHLEAGHTPLLVVLLPQGVESCVDQGDMLCSANATAIGGAKGQFCSYHSSVNVGGINYSYVVQPWTIYTGCDEQNLPPLPSPFTAIQQSDDAATRLESPLSAGMMAAVVNPWLNGWFNNNDYAEIDDNVYNNVGCGQGGGGPQGYPYDAVTLGSASTTYYLQPEFSNAGVLVSDPNSPACALGVALSAMFVAPTAVDQGDEVQLDGSDSVTSLLIPGVNYRWNFGDGSTATGASVVHTYTSAGTFTVTLTVTDRGGNVSSFSQPVVVLGPNGQPGQPGPPPAIAPSPGLSVQLQLMPQSRRTMLRNGLAVRVTSNLSADGIVTLSISRAQARRAHMKVGRGPVIVLGRGTVSSIKAGTVTLHLHLSRSVVAKLGRLKHVTVNVRFAVFAAGGRYAAVDVAGRY
ncbi:MAG: PKD domain-containing protein [Chloroflexi bacterium]|nr:PKD domain-containing protein [Chloroflexota bacterium]